ncbi:MAG: M1 family aminopeptidase [Bryobacteraceae bacterium]|jgi:hypothetical protein
MTRWLLALILLLPAAAPAATAADVARAIREIAFDHEECYRVRDLVAPQEDIRLFLGDGHLIFAKPAAGRRIAAVFTADTEEGEGEIMLFPPNRAERQSLAGYIDSPNLDEHISAALLLFTGDAYDKLKAQIAANPANRKSPEVAPLLDERWISTLRTLAISYETRLALDLLGGPASRAGLFAALLESPQLGVFDVIFDPWAEEQILAGKVATRDGRVYFDMWTSFQARSFRDRPPSPVRDVNVSSYRIEATIGADLSMTAIARLKLKPAIDSLTVVPFEISPQMQVTQVLVDGRPAEALQRDALRANLGLAGNELMLVVPPEPLRQGREYEFEFHYSGKVILDAGGGVYYVGARADWYPIHGMQFADYDLLFRYPRNLDLVTPGDVVEDRVEGDERITRRRTSAPIRLAGFNLGNYEHARATRGPYEVDVCANRALETALQPPREALSAPPDVTIRRQRGRGPELSPPPIPLPLQPPNPLARLQELASDVASALEFMASKFGPPALPRLTVSPIPGTFGQGFPGLIYLSTLSYLQNLPASAGASRSLDLFFQDMLYAHEVAHQWWGNRVTAAGYHDAWLQEALANYSALLYLEQQKGQAALDLMLDSYRSSLLEKSESGQTVESAGPIVLGERLVSSVEPRAWRAITYGKGSWIMQMLRARMGRERFFSMLAEVLRRYDHKVLSTEQFREVAAQFLPPKSDDPKLEAFFNQWVYGTGIPTLKLSYALKGKAPAMQLVGTLAQSGVDEDFSVLTPIEIQVDRDHSMTQWVRSSGGSVGFTVALRQPPLKVTLDPHDAVLRQ